MIEKLLLWFYNLAARHGGRLLAGFALAMLASAALIPGLKISSSYSDLAPEDHPEELLYRKFLNEFGSANDFVVVLEGDPAQTRVAADLLAAGIGKNAELVSDVYYRLDLDRFLESAPLYLDTATLQSALARMSGSESILNAVLQDAVNLPSLVDTLAKGMRGDLGGATLDGDQTLQAVESVGRFLAEWRRWIEEPGQEAFQIEGLALDELDADESQIELLKSAGYLTSFDRRMHFLFVRPASTRDEVAYLERIDAVIRRAWQDVGERQPELVSDLTLAVTGLPAHTLTDVRSVRADVTRVLVPSALLVVIILLSGLRSFRKGILALVTLGCALVIAMAAMRLVFGTLNRVSASFLAVLFGIGIDFSIYLIRRTDEEVGGGHALPDAVRRAVMISGKGILAGGLVTGLAFFSTSFVENGGLAQMGQTAGLGVLITLLVTFLLLPTLLLRFSGSGKTTSSPAPGGAAPLAPRAEEGLEPGLRGATWLILMLLLLPALFGIHAARQIQFDYNILRLLPRHAESTLYQLRMQEESDFQMSAAFVTADSFEEMRALEAKLSALPEVARVVSLTQLVPGDQEAKLELLRENSRFLRAMAPSWTPDPAADAAVYAKSLASLADAIEGVEESGFSTGNTELMTAAGESLDALTAMRATFRDTGDAALKRTSAFETTLFDLIIRSGELARNWAALEPIDETSLPPSFRSRFIGETGRYAAYVYPSGSMWELEVLDRFVTSVREITPGLTGFPVAMRTNVRLMVNGLVQALLFSLTVVVVLLGLDFRSVKKLILVLIPLVVGMLWLQAWIHLTGQGYNLASIIGLPLLLGLGVVYGVHILHRWSEHPESGGFHAVKTSGRAIALAALTTAAGLVSLTFSLHRGVVTFSLILLQGIFFMLAAALTALPLLLNTRWARAGKASQPIPEAPEKTP